MTRMVLICECFVWGGWVGVVRVLQEVTIPPRALGGYEMSSNSLIVRAAQDERETVSFDFDESGSCTAPNL